MARPSWDSCFYKNSARSYLGNRPREETILAFSLHIPQNQQNRSRVANGCKRNQTHLIAQNKALCGALRAPGSKVASRRQDSFPIA